MTTTKYSGVLGIDASKSRLDCHLWPRGEAFAVANTADGLHQLERRLAAAGAVEAVAIEASGGCERLAVRHLRAAGCTVLVLPPAEVRAFAELRRRRAKNDRLDAATIAEFAAHFGEARPPRPPALERLAEHLTYYEQVSADVAQTRTRLAAFSEAELRARVEQEIRRRLADKRAALARLRALVRAEPELARRVRRLATMPGIGFLSAVNLAVRLPELGALSRRAIASLAGLAPYDRDSGGTHRCRAIRGGRERARTGLFMGALTASRRNPALAGFYRRLLAAGKAHKVALVAVMRKMLVILNAMLRDGRDWSDRAQQTAA